MVIEAIVSVPFPLFVKITGIKADGVLTGVFGKVTDVGLKLTATKVPVPVSVTT